MTRLVVRPGDVVHISHLELTSIAKILQNDTGIRILPTQASMLQSRLGRRLRHLGLRHFVDYVNLVQTPQGEGERRAMISALTTNVTSFYRERHHFDFFCKHVVPDLLRRARQGEPVRIWSAGCSTGQEPFSLAMCLNRMAKDLSELDIKILATDIDHEILVRARNGLYPVDALSNVPATDIQTFFVPEKDAFRICDDIRNLVHFRELNLSAVWPMRRPFDVIFCRNVAIYFDEVSRNKLWNRLESALTDGGWLFLGHAERIPPSDLTRLETAGITIYRAPATQQISC